LPVGGEGDSPFAVGVCVWGGGGGRFSTIAWKRKAGGVKNQFNHPVQVHHRIR
jgi:hypothetical protein